MINEQSVAMLTLLILVVMWLYVAFHDDIDKNERQ